MICKYMNPVIAPQIHGIVGGNVIRKYMNPVIAPQIHGIVGGNVICKYIVHWELPEEPKLNVDSNANFPIYYEMHRPKDMTLHRLDNATNYCSSLASRTQDCSILFARTSCLIDLRALTTFFQEPLESLVSQAFMAAESLSENSRYCSSMFLSTAYSTSSWIQRSFKSDQATTFSSRVRSLS